MSYDAETQSKQDNSKTGLKVGLAVLAVAIAIGFAVYSGVKSQAPATKVVGTLGADGKINYYKDGAPTPAAGADALPPSKQ